MNTPSFPTPAHQAAAEAVGAFFAGQPLVDTVLVVNSCARGRAEPESDLDFAILLAPAAPPAATEALEAAWQRFAATAPAVQHYLHSGPFAQLHLDLIPGVYAPGPLEPGGPPDYFEVEIGNHLCYAAPLGPAGAHLRALHARWRPYYAEPLRRERLAQARAACAYEIEHIPVYARRGLHFYAFDRLYVGLQKYLQALFISARTYPLGYNKWIKEQIVDILHRPDLYPPLTALLSITNLESDEVVRHAGHLQALLDQLPEA